MVRPTKNTNAPSVIHSLDAATQDILILSKYWGLDPDIVSAWSMPDFMDRQEFMFIRMELENPGNDPITEEEIWTGR